MDNHQETAWTVDSLDVAALLSKELNERFTPDRVTPEMVKHIAQAYHAAFKDFVDDHGISFRGTRLPSEVWDAVEDLAKPHHREQDDD